MEYDIFISYSRKDSQIVNRFVRELTNIGYRVWIDRKGIVGGNEFMAEIVQAIKKSAIVIFFSSANSNSSKWTVNEISYSLKKGKTIIPIRIDDTEYEDSIDFALVNIDFIQYQKQDPSSAIERLIFSIETYIGKPAHPSTPTTPNNTQKQHQETSTFERILSSASKYIGTIKNSDTSNNKQKSKSTSKHYSLGLSSIEKGEYELAAEYFILAAEQGDSKAQNALGLCYEYGQGVPQNYHEAVKWYQKAAEQGNTNAQNNLGQCYEKGIGVNQDHQEAIIWFRIAAERGNSTAQYNLGIHYDNGQCVNKDYQESVKWYRKAAEQGHAEAQYNLAYRYFEGRGIKQNFQEAAKWFLKAAEQGHKRAQYELCLCYKYGQGVPQDNEESEKWRPKASEYDAWAIEPENIWYVDGKGLEHEHQEAILTHIRILEQARNENLSI